MKKILERLGRTLLLGPLLVHCATEADSGSQTHWVTCKQDGDCDAGPCVAGRCPQKGSGTWLGVPCEECDLRTQVARLADPASEDCGSISLDAGDAGRANGEECARAALEAGRPFTLIVEQAGIDSLVRSARVFASGRLYFLEYDSNVCGGAYDCNVVGCGPQMHLQTCVGPLPPNPLGTMAPCTSLIGPQTICAPAPWCYAGTCS